MRRRREVVANGDGGERWGEREGQRVDEREEGSESARESARRGEECKRRGMQIRNAWAESRRKRARVAWEDREGGTGLEGGI